MTTERLPARLPALPPLFSLASGERKERGEWLSYIPMAAAQMRSQHDNLQSTRKSIWFAGLLLFLIVSAVTWFVIPAQPRRVLTASIEPDRRFVALFPGSGRALTARREKNNDKDSRLSGPFRLYDLKSGKETVDVIDAGDANNASEFPNFKTSLSPGGSLLGISLGFGKTMLQVCDLASGKRLASLPQFYAGYGDVRAFSWFSPDSQHLAYVSLIGSADQVENDTKTGFVSAPTPLRVWHRANDRDEVLIADTLGAPPAFSPDSRRIAAIVMAADHHSYSHVGVFDLSTGQEVARLSLEKFQKFVLCLSWMPDGKHLVLADRTGNDPTTTRITSWDIDAGTTQVLLSRDALPKSRENFVQDIQEMRFSSDGRYIWLREVLMGNSVIWDLDSSPPKRVGYSRESGFHLSPERPCAVVGESPVTQRLWQAGTAVEQAPILVKSELVIHSVSQNNQGDLVSIAHFDGKATILDFWETKSGRKVSSYVNKTFGGFSEDGERFYVWPPFGQTPGETIVLGQPQARSIEEWGVVPGSPWHLLVIAWCIEGALIVFAWVVGRGCRAGVACRNGNGQVFGTSCITRC